MGIYKQVRIRGEAVFRDTWCWLTNEIVGASEARSDLSGRLNCRVIPVNRGYPHDRPITGRGGKSFRPGIRAFRARDFFSARRRGTVKDR